jgi:Ca2+-binding RTX toxin-like protein
MMSRVRRRPAHHFSLLGAALAVGALAVPITTALPASAAAACSFSDGIVRVVLQSGGAATISVGAGGEILVDSVQCDLATATDTNGVEVRGRRGAEKVTLDLLDPPVSTAEHPVVVQAYLGAGTDVLAVVGSAGPDFVSIDDTGISLSSDPARGPDVLPTGVETAVLSGAGGDDALGVAPGASVVVAGRLIVRGGGDADRLAGGPGRDGLVGNSGDDRVIGRGGPDRIVGGPGTDLLVGGSGRDVASGQDGSDSLVGGEDADRLAGGAGGDALAGGAGNDTVDGGSDRDELLGEDGRDQLAGGDGMDAVNGGGGPDVAAGGGDDDRLAGGPGTGADRLVGGTGRDRMIGGGGPDAAIGGEDGDELVGGAGRDRLVGGDGADEATGGLARDVAAGGPGADRLAGGASDDNLKGEGGRDLLLGENGSDMLAGGPGLDTCHQGNGKGRKSSCENPPPAPPLPLSPAGRIMVVNQNLKEVHTHVADDIFPRYGDQERSLELWNFARRLSNILRYTPDVLVLQEVSRAAAVKTAAKLSDRFGVPYWAVVRPRKALWVELIVRDGTLKGIDVYKNNTAIVINARTMEYGRGGHLATPQLERDRDEDGIRTIQHQAHALIREKKSGIAMSAMSIHFNSNNFFASRELGENRRTRWTDRVATFARQRYPGRATRLMGGEFCERRCEEGGLEVVDCVEKRFWNILTRDFGYRDAVYVANSTSDADLEEQARSRAGRPMRIDYIFARPTVIDASRDITYTADEGDSNYISDHRGNWAVVELRR